MPGIPREVIEHHLKIYPNARLVQQKPRKQSLERQNFIREEIKKLLKAGFIREVHHPRWLASYGRSTTLGGWPTLLSSLWLARSSGCASTTRVSTRYVPKTLSLFHE
jgi:hypothetical protein